jgi:hypothetical protein
MPNVSYEIEFIGGPYDGYRQVLTTPLNELAEIVALPVSRDIVRLFDGEARGLGAPTTSVAVYQLEVSSNKCRHRFVGAASPMLPDTETTRPLCSANRSGHER